MPKLKRQYIIIGALGITIVAAIFMAYNVLSAPTETETVAQVVQPQSLADSNLPVKGWYVCKDLGVGPVPGRVRPRQRIVLCHPDGWEIKTYCLNPNLPQPKLGTSCSRIGKKTYWCGNGIQPLKEYGEPPPPTPNFTPTYTPTPTVTNTPNPTPPPTPTATKRPKTGGPSYRDINDQRIFSITVTPTVIPNTSYRPENQSNNSPLDSTNLKDNLSGVFYGIDFNNTQTRVHIKIIPPNKRVNGGRPINISFIPSQHCKFGSQTACVNISQGGVNGKTIFLTIHSGVGGQAQAYRHAMEGTGYDTATLPLREIKKNVKELTGAKVIIYQGGKRVGGFVLAGSSRVPPKFTRIYFDLALPDSLKLAAGIDSSLARFTTPDQPQIVFETCGWKVPGEKWTAGLSNTQSSVYIGVIRRAP
jgi:hypothetical protein